MKRVIEGKVYDTDTAELLHVWENMADTGDFRYCSEELYMTQRGSYFIAGEGGAMSPYAESLGGGNWSNGNGIEPVSKDRAMKWLEEHHGHDVLLERFSEDLEPA